MLIGYARVSKADGSQSLDLQLDALRAAGVQQDQIYEDRASGSRDDSAGPRSLSAGVARERRACVWKLTGWGGPSPIWSTPSKTCQDAGGLRVLTGKGAQIDTTTSSGRMIFGIFATLAEFERDLIRERTVAGLAAARARGRKGGRKFALTKAQVRLAQAAMGERDTSVSALCVELGIQRVTLYRYVGPNGELRDYGKRVSRPKRRPSRPSQQTTPDLRSGAGGNSTWGPVGTRIDAPSRREMQGEFGSLRVIKTAKRRIAFLGQNGQNLSPQGGRCARF